MGRIDEAQMRFFRIPHHFADIWNGMAFNGKQVIDWRDLTEISPVGLSTRGGKTMKRTSDMVMAKTKDGEQLAIMIVENQTTVDYRLVVRVHSREAMEYERQVSIIESRNKEKLAENVLKDQTSGEYLYNFLKTDRLRPVTTLVLYWNENGWDGARSLHDLINFEGCEEIKSLVADFKMNLVDIDSIDGELDLFKDKEVRDVIALFKRRHNKESFKEYLHTNCKDIDDDCADVVGTMTGSKMLGKSIKTWRSKKGDDKMVENAIDALYYDGRVDGRKERNLELAENLLREGDNVKKIARVCELSELKVKELAKSLGIVLA